MILSYNDRRIRYTGRWFMGESAAITTCAGASFEVGFTGDSLVLHLDMESASATPPHLYISIDGGVKTEVPTDTYLRVEVPTGGRHILWCIVKSQDEEERRWVNPACRVKLEWVSAEDFFELPADTRPVIEFVGDSITEGVLIDEEQVRFGTGGGVPRDRVYQDDSTATYAYLTATALGLRPQIMGYGAVGVTRSGQGGVPRAALAYPFCFEGAPLAPRRVDYVVCNHGTNDRSAGKEEFVSRYTELLDLIRATHPEAKVVSLSPFVGSLDETLRETVAAYNESRGADVFFIPTGGWISPEPLHPTRAGHRTVAEHLIPILRSHFGL